MRRSLACLPSTILLMPFSLFLANSANSIYGGDLPPALDRRVDFATDVQPLLKKHCIACHGPEKQESGFRLDRAELAMAGGDSGKAILVGQSAQSRLIQYVAGIVPDHVMPPEGNRLTSNEVGLLRTWIDGGATWSEDANAQVARNTHWAYQPLAKVVPPAVSHTDWVRNPIDQFILARLEALGLTPAPEADRVTLVRRLTLDLLGLLPSIEEVDAFVNDADPSAYERLVDRLLDSPHFGERWGRHWLDMARYADSDGYEKDNARPDAYRYRDWVIDAINDDMPYDQFTIEQLAGDLLPNATAMQKLATAFHRQTLTNTEGGTDPEQFRVEACFDRTETTGAVWLGLTIGCARCHTHKYDAITQREYYQLFAFFNNGDESTVDVPRSVSELQTYQSEVDRHNEKVAVVQADLTAAQAKIQADFDTWENEARQQSASEESKLPDAIVKLLRIAPEKRTEKQRDRLFDHFSRQAAPTKTLHEKLDALKKQAPAGPEIKARVFVQRSEKPRETYVLRRGEFLEPIVEAEVAANGLSVLPPLTSRHGASVSPIPSSSSTAAITSTDTSSSSNTNSNSNTVAPKADRLDLARWLVSTDNPLTPRVTVNHVWQTLFGAGLVKTANDFGVRGERPTHPDLLDWLAGEFIGLHGPAALGGKPAWSRKGLIKLIVMSGTYRQSSRVDQAIQELDPQNQLLARQNRLRVEGEIVRDVSLDAAGLLAKKIGGPSVYPPLPPGIAELSYAGNFKWTTSKGDDQYRRGMYTFFKRTAPHPNLITFDCPDANLACVDRNTSNTPLQALVALNNASFAEAARGLAVRALSDQDAGNDGARLDKAFRWCLARHASDLERGQLLDLLSSSRAWYLDHPDDARRLVDKSLPASVKVEEVAAWVSVARVLINLDEFITRE